METNLIVLELKKIEEVEGVLKQIDCDPKGIQIMKHKALFRLIKIEHIRTKAANLLKQTFLAKGAEVAIAKGSADLSIEYTDALVMATIKQYRQAILNLKMQPWGLADIAKKIEKILDDTLVDQEREYQWADRTLHVENTGYLLVGCIDLVEQKYDAKMIMKEADRLQQEGANALELFTEGRDDRAARQHEHEHLYPLLTLMISSYMLPIIVQSSNMRVIEHSLLNGVHMVDIPGGFGSETKMAKMIAKYKVPVIISNDFREISSSASLMKEILAFSQKNIKMARQAGIDSDDLIIAPCGGFFENCAYAFHIIMHIEQLMGLGCPIFINFSAKKQEISSLLPLMKQKEALLSAVVVGHMKGIRIFGGHEIGEIKSLLNTLEKMRRVEQDDENFDQ